MSWVRFAGPLKAYLRRYSTAAGIPSSRETSRPVSGIRPREFSARVCDALHREPTRRLPVRRQHNRPPGADHTRISIPERHLVRFTKQLTTFASGTITRDQETCIPERLKRYHRSRPSAPRARRRAWAGPGFRALSDRSHSHSSAERQMVSRSPDRVDYPSNWSILYVSATSADGSPRRRCRVTTGKAGSLTNLM